jgi:hypothetical protein
MPVCQVTAAVVCRRVQFNFAGIDSHRESGEAWLGCAQREALDLVGDFQSVAFHHGPRPVAQEASQRRVDHPANQHADDGHVEHIGAQGQQAAILEEEGLDTSVTNLCN